MKNRKGFTITELVIVIAVIAILAAVLIPTFSGVVTKANQNSELQKVRSAYTQYMSDNAQSSDLKTKVKVDCNGYWIQVDNGSCTIVTSEPGNGYTEMVISGNALILATEPPATTTTPAGQGG